VIRIRPLSSDPGQDGVVEAENEAAGRPDRKGEEFLRDLSWRQLLRLAAGAPDSFLLVLFLLVVDYVLITITWSGGAALVVRSAVFLLTLLLALHTSRVRQRTQKLARLIAALSMVAVLIIAIFGQDPAVGAVVLLSSLLLLATPLAIGWRILHHQEVTTETIAGAICIYVLIGLVFAYLDYGIQLASGSDFFAQSGHHGLPDFTYFSYITMATVGYGDLTPATGVPRTMSVLDALVGQVFLVVLLARLVSLYRGPVSWRRGLQERLGGEAGGAGGPGGGPTPTQPPPPAET
jgi:hypothetical protein